MTTTFHQAASRALDQNQISLPDNRYAFVAGQNQFKSLWTRDFSHSVPGLLAAGLSESVAQHLDLLLRHLRPSDGLVPRILDGYAPRMRVVWNSAKRILPIMPALGFGRPLMPEYRDEHGSEAVDSNFLLLLAVHAFFKATTDRRWIDERRALLQRSLDYYFLSGRWDGSWFRQGPFEDWQDSLRRDGVTFYTNFLAERALLAAEELGLKNSGRVDVRNLQTRIVDGFYRSTDGFFRSRLKDDTIGADGVFLALATDFFAGQKESIYRTYLQSEYWNASPLGVPGFVTKSHYPPSEKSLAVRLVGLQNYHEDMYWSWLMAQAALAAKNCGDVFEARRILTTLEAFFDRDGEVYEIYDPSSGRPWRKTLYGSEAPFTWGAAKYAEAVFCLA